MLANYCFLLLPQDKAKAVTLPWAAGEQLPSGTSGVINTHDQHSFIKHAGLGNSGASILFGFNKTDAVFNILLLDSSNLSHHLWKWVKNSSESTCGA